MKVISIWNPYALLLAHGHKTIETRSWAAPKSLIGQRIGIASTKLVKHEQRLAFGDQEFQRHYAALGLPQKIDDLPNGCLLATALLNSCDLMTETDIEDTTDEEKAYGVFGAGRYAWRLRYVERLHTPIPVKGAQGVWEIDEHVLRRSSFHIVG